MVYGFPCNLSGDMYFVVPITVAFIWGLVSSSSRGSRWETIPKSANLTLPDDDMRTFADCWIYHNIEKRIRWEDKIYKHICDSCLLTLISLCNTDSKCKYPKPHIIWYAMAATVPSGNPTVLLLWRDVNPRKSGLVGNPSELHWSKSEMDPRSINSSTYIMCTKLEWSKEVWDYSTEKELTNVTAPSSESKKAPSNSTKHSHPPSPLAVVQSNFNSLNSIFLFSWDCIQNILSA